MIHLILAKNAKAEVKIKRKTIHYLHVVWAREGADWFACFFSLHCGGIILFPLKIYFLFCAHQRAAVNVRKRRVAVDGMRLLYSSKLASRHQGREKYNL